MIIIWAYIFLSRREVVLQRWWKHCLKQLRYTNNNINIYFQCLDCLSSVITIDTEYLWPSLSVLYTAWLYRAVDYLALVPVDCVIFRLDFTSRIVDKSLPQTHHQLASISTWLSLSISLSLCMCVCVCRHWVVCSRQINSNLTHSSYIRRSPITLNIQVLHVTRCPAGFTTHCTPSVRPSVRLSVCLSRTLNNKKTQGLA